MDGGFDRLTFHGIKSVLLCFFILVGSLFVGCEQTPRKLPIYGQPTFVEGDTLYPVIPDFALLAENGDTFNQNQIAGKVYLAEFMFLKCPTVCLKTTAMMARLHRDFAADERFMMLSHTLDPSSDSLSMLRAHAQAQGAQYLRWRFLWGNEADMYKLAHAYMIQANRDEMAPGGVLHSGAILLIDKQKHIRGVYDGTNEQMYYQIKEDIRRLLEEG